MTNLIYTCSRVSELETENARLIALSQSSQVSSNPSALASEVEQLRAELAAVRDRERELSAQLASRSEPTVKLEASDSNALLSSPARSPNLPFPNKTGASLGLMVCAKFSYPSSVPQRQQSRSSCVPFLASFQCLCTAFRIPVLRFQHPFHHLLLISTPTFPQTMIGPDPLPPPSWISTLITIFLTLRL